MSADNVFMTMKYDLGDVDFIATYRQKNIHPWNLGGRSCIGRYVYLVFFLCIFLTLAFIYVYTGTF